MAIDTTHVTDEDAPLVIDVGPPVLIERAEGFISLVADEDDQPLAFATVDEAVEFLRANVSGQELHERTWRLLPRAHCQID